MDRVAKPPIGVKSRRLHEELRMDDLMGAIIRYMQIHKEIPIAWVNEYNELVIRRATDED